MSTKKAYQQKIEAEVELAQAKLAELRAEVKSASADARIKYENCAKELELKIDATQAKLQELSKANEDAWEHLKGNAEITWNTLSSAVQDTATKLKAQFKD